MTEDNRPPKAQPAITFGNSYNDKKDEKGDDKQTKMSVILGRDLVFIHWGVIFGSNILSLFVGGILGVILGINFFSLFIANPSSEAFTLYLFSILLCIVGLSLFYSRRIGVRINSADGKEKNRLNLLKVLFFALSWTLGLSFTYNNWVAPWLGKMYEDPGAGNGNGGGDGVDDGGGGIDFGTTDDIIIAYTMMVLSVAMVALLYAGVIYGFAKRINIPVPVAIAIAVSMMTITLISSQAVPAIMFSLFEGKYVRFMFELLLYLLMSIVIILSYHMSKRIELSIIVLFIGLYFTMNAPDGSIINVLIALKYGFPNLSDGITTTSDVLTLIVRNSQIAGFFAMILYPLIFYRDMAKFGKNLFITFKNHGKGIILFFLVFFLIEIIITFLVILQLGFLVYIIVLMLLIFVFNKLIQAKYGKFSHTGQLAAMQSAFQVSEPLFTKFEQQKELLEKSFRKDDRLAIGTLTVIPVILYYTIMYITTALTTNATTDEKVFIIIIIPLSIAVAAFSTALFYVKNPIMKEQFNYPLKAVSIIGFVMYYLLALEKMVYNEIGVFPIISMFYGLLVLLTIKRRKSLGYLIFHLPSDDKKKVLKELLTRKDLPLNMLEEYLYDIPPFLKAPVVTVMTKRDRTNQNVNKELEVMIKSEFPYIRALAALNILYQDLEQTEEEVKETNYSKFIEKLENDPHPDVRKAIAYGLRHAKRINEQEFRNLIDTQHYEENREVHEMTKQTIMMLEKKFMKKEDEKNLKEI